MSISTIPPYSPKRRGIHQIYGVYLERSGLDNEYRLVKVNSYKFTSQLRNVKQAGISERTLMNSRENSSLYKFNGKLEVLTTTGTSEMDKEDFIEYLKDKTSYYGLQYYFYLPNSDKKMIPLLSYLHTFSLK